jgi:hypothetical protein
MPTTIREDAPHPDSYRPDLPLRSELNATTEREEAARDAGYQDGYEDAAVELSGKERRLERELETTRKELSALKNPA